MNRQEKRHARISALKMAYAYTMTEDKDNLHRNNCIDDDFEKMEEVIGYAKKLVDNDNEIINLARLVDNDELALKWKLREIFLFLQKQESRIGPLFCQILHLHMSK